MFIVKYTKAVYTAKITEIEGYKNLLETHLNKLKELKDDMFTFWDDDRAREASKNLFITTRQVEDALSRVSELLIAYKSAVEKYDGTSAAAEDLINESVSILEALGI